MTKSQLLDNLKKFTESAVKDILLPVREQEEDRKKPMPRSAEVFKMRLPDSSEYKKKAPYILHQIIAGSDSQSPGRRAAGNAIVRSVFCVYCADEQEGALHLLNLMESLRIELLKRVVIGKQFQLDLEEGLEFLIYPDDSAPYYGAEMISTWIVPALEREETAYYG